MMKRFVTIALIAVMAVTVLATAGFTAKYTNGEYVGVVLNEKRGHTVISVSIWNNTIVNVEVINQVKIASNYTHEGGILAFHEYPGKVLAKQAGNIDVVAGATSSYNNYNAAVEMALQQAAGTYTGDVFYGLSRDYAHGHVLIEVTLNKAKDKIEAVKFITQNESYKDREPMMAAKTSKYPYKEGIEVFSTFPTKVLKAQNVQVDGVAGATHSNHAFEAALRNALNAAGVLKKFE